MLFEQSKTAIWLKFLRFGLRDLNALAIFAICDLEHLVEVSSRYFPEFLEMAEEIPETATVFWSLLSRAPANGPLYMGKMGLICHFPCALPASIWGHCSQVLVFTSIWGCFSQHLGNLGPPNTAKHGKTQNDKSTLFYPPTGGGVNFEIPGVPDIDPFSQRFYRKSPIWGFKSVEIHLLNDHLGLKRQQKMAQQGPAASAQIIVHQMATSYNKPSSSCVINNILSVSGECDFNMVAELSIAPPNRTTTSGLSTITATVTAEAAAATATIFMIIWLSAAAYIIIRYIILPHRYRANLAMARCQPSIQNNNLTLLPYCLICNDNDCISDTTSAGNPSSSTSASVATDNCNLVENVAFYINMMAHPNTRLPMPTSFDGNTPPFLEWTSEVRGLSSTQRLRVLDQPRHGFQRGQPGQPQRHLHRPGRHRGH